MNRLEISLDRTEVRIVEVCDGCGKDVPDRVWWVFRAPPLRRLCADCQQAAADEAVIE